MPHDMTPVAPHRLSRFDETRIDLPEAHFGDAGEEWRGAGGERNDGRPDPDRRSDKEPRQRQERHEENSEGRGSESIHDRRKRSARPLAPAGCGPRRPRKSDFTTVAANPRRSRPAFHTPSAATRRRPRFAEKGNRADRFNSMTCVHAVAHKEGGDAAERFPADSKLQCFSGPPRGRRPASDRPRRSSCPMWCRSPYPFESCTDQRRRWLRRLRSGSRCCSPWRRSCRSGCEGF